MRSELFPLSLGFLLVGSRDATTGSWFFFGDAGVDLLLSGLLFAGEDEVLDGFESGGVAGRDPWEDEAKLDSLLNI